MDFTLRKRKNILYTIQNPFQQFINTEATGGILLIFFTVFALIWANSGWAGTYHSLWQQKLTIGLGEFALSKTLGQWINDGLMAIFFFVVGLEIKREIVAGELSSIRQATLPFAAAIGGMLIPAGLFILLLGRNPGIEGWGIPMATDIAFSLGILSLLGKRVPLSLKIFLTAFAIVDDLGAVMVIALFYSSGIVWSSLLIALGLIVVLIIFNITGVRRIPLYMIVGFVIWYLFLTSGIHPTLAAVIVAMTIPVHRKVKAHVFVRKMQSNLDDFCKDDCRDGVVLTKKQLVALDNMEWLAYRVQSPVQELEHSLHGFVTFIVMPIFALANAGVDLTPGDFSIVNPLTSSIALSLVFGKVLGVVLGVFIVVRLGMGRMPGNTRWPHMIGVGLLGGVGFTMSLFISNLAYSDALMLNEAKIGILIGSLVAGIAGYLILRNTLSESDGIESLETG
jgi:NhaA family Na+:H+ antiporter